jgi:hypothetical protein
MVTQWASNSTIGTYPKLRIQQDFGVWIVTYQTVPCEPDWEGSEDAAALGSVTNLGIESVCCPANPTVSIDKMLCDRCYPYLSGDRGVRTTLALHIQIKMVYRMSVLLGLLPNLKTLSCRPDTTTSDALSLALPCAFVSILGYLLLYIIELYPCTGLF